MTSDADVFRRRVIAIVRRIPPGEVATYGDVADAAGYPRAARAVGNVMKSCSTPGVPCHRVVAAGGRLGGYGGNESLKRALLRAEGLAVTTKRITNFADRRWRNRRSSRP
ncbi:MAG TPA: MGMT family protein [Vicinamibacterales bacterium]|jgi:O-6-methylguanine DNA methyltransferase|nr:MGMT family protein [Vicinamibacterales bacterium]